MRERICKISLFSAILACVATMPLDAAVKTKNSNRSYAGGYQQVNAMRQQQEYAANMAAEAAANLPVAVDDENLANAIANNEASAPSVSDLEACSMIYSTEPKGNVKWGVPESGSRQGQEPQCVAVVELKDANTNAVLATTTVAVDDSMKCNIDFFPEYSYNMTALANVTLPADNEPTMKDVEAAMNQEQKQNAGLKIAAGAIIAGVAGNLLAPKTAGKSDNKKSKINIPLGMGGTQLKDTAIGAVAGAGIMAASTYSGKVAGDTIKSTAVNAASGMIIGNMKAGMSGGQDILAITKCSVGEKGNEKEYDCVIGNFERYGADFQVDGKGIEVTSGDNKEDSDICGAKSSCDTNDDSKKPRYFISIKGTTLQKCCVCGSAANIYTCVSANKKLANMTVAGRKDDGTIQCSGNIGNTTIPMDLNKATHDSQYITAGTNLFIINQDTDNSKKFTLISDNANAGDNSYFALCGAKELSSTTMAYAVFENGLKNKMFGYEAKDWQDIIKDNQPTYYKRNSSGSVGEKIDFKSGEGDFKPSTRDAEDGGIVDLSNQARTKGTLVGTGVGGALGGFAGYQGAKSEVSERWTAAVREYNDSLSNFVCMSGRRWLSMYNSEVLIQSQNQQQQ